MDKWLDSLSVSQTPRVRIPLNVPSFLFSSYHILHLQFIGLYVHMRRQNSDLGCRSGCKHTNKNQAQEHYVPNLTLALSAWVRGKPEFWRCLDVWSQTSVWLHLSETHTQTKEAWGRGHTQTRKAWGCGHTHTREVWDEATPTQGKSEMRPHLDKGSLGQGHTQTREVWDEATPGGGKFGDEATPGGGKSGTRPHPEEGTRLGEFPTGEHNYNA